MADLTRFAITRRWPAAHPDRLQLYSTPTPNGVKVSIALEEIGLAYEPHFIDIGAQESWTPEFLALNPNGKILAEKTGRLLPGAPAGRLETIQWVFFQVGGIGPMFGQVGYFTKFAGREIEDKRPRDRYLQESKRLLGVLEGRLADRTWIMGDDFTIADIAILGWVRGMVGFYGAGELVDYGSLRAVPAWLERGLARPAVQRGLLIPERPA
jgi:GSH-dependent disulfide-bond oxidoreductase